MSHKEDVFGKAYERGTVVFRQGEVGHSVYIIQSGAVEVSQIQGHHEAVIAVLEKGDFFGEMALIDPEPRSCTVTAIGHTRLLSMTKNALLDRLRRDPGVMLHLLKGLSSRITETNQLLRSVIEGDETLLSAGEVNHGGGSAEVPPASGYIGKQPSTVSVPEQNEDKEDLSALGRLPFDVSEGVLFEPGARIFSQGDPGDALYIISEGEVEIFQESEKGKCVLARLGRGQFFGEMALIGDQFRTATVVAVTPIRVIVLKRSEFLEKTRLMPELGLYVLQVMTRRLRHTLRAVSNPSESMDLVRQILPPLVKKAAAIRLSFVSLSTCGGCTAAILEDQNELQDLLAKTDVLYCPMLMDQDRLVESDLILVDGIVRVKEDEEMLAEARRKSRFLVAWGSCSAFGGIPALANQYELEDLIEGSYGQAQDAFAHYLGGISGLSPKAYQGDGVSLLRRAGKVDDYVRVDFYLSGCPPPVTLLNELIRELRGEERKLKKRVTVCSECRRKPLKSSADCFWVFPKPEWEGEHCFSSRGAMCMGFVTRGGCGAACPNGGLPCWGCRGPSEILLKKMENGNSAEALLLRLLVRSCNLDEEQIRPVMEIVRTRANTMLGFYEHLRHARSRLR